MLQCKLPFDQEATVSWKSSPIWVCFAQSQMLNSKLTLTPVVMDEFLAFFSIIHNCQWTGNCPHSMSYCPFESKQFGQHRRHMNWIVIQAELCIASSHVRWHFKAPLDKRRIRDCRFYHPPLSKQQGCTSDTRRRLWWRRSKCWISLLVKVQKLKKD